MIIFIVNDAFVKRPWDRHMQIKDVLIQPFGVRKNENELRTLDGGLCMGISQLLQPGSRNLMVKKAKVIMQHRPFYPIFIIGMFMLFS